MSGSEIEIAVKGTPEEALDEQKAVEIMTTLLKHYPGHEWMVEFTGGVHVIRHRDISTLIEMLLPMCKGFGYNIKGWDIHSAKELAHQAMIGGGQILEAFGLPRGPNDGREPIIPSPESLGLPGLRLRH